MHGQLLQVDSVTLQKKKEGNVKKNSSSTELQKAIMIVFFNIHIRLKTTIFCHKDSFLENFCSHL